MYPLASVRVAPGFGIKPPVESLSARPIGTACALRSPAMSRSAAVHPVLRLANADRPVATAVMPRRHTSASAAARMTAVFHPQISDIDARWVLAVRAAGLLQGGRAALLIPEHRRLLLVLAARMGLRPFDASLIIAIVQDAARSGLEPLGAQTENRLLMVPSARSASSPEPRATRLIALSTCLAGALFAGLLGWIGAL